jgi:hypothetical protein
MRKFFFAAALAVVALFGSTKSADAAFQVTLGTSAGSVTIVDGGVGDIDGMVNNSIQYNTVAGGYTFTGGLTQTNSPGGVISFISPQGVGSIVGDGATTVFITASANGFTQPPIGLTSAISGSTFQFLATSSAGSATHSYTATYDATNALSTVTPGGVVIGAQSVGGINTPAGNSDLNDSRLFNITAVPYALNLRIQAVLTGTGTNRVDLDGTLEIANAVPAPAGLVLGLAGLPLVALLRRRAAKA